METNRRSCVQNWTESNGNKISDPQFVYDQPPYGYYHIKYESDCREGGDSGDYPNEEDMDAQDRVYDTQVDIGADEYSCEETWHENDWTYDGIINLEDFAILSSEWLGCQQGTYPQSDLNQDHCVDLDDLILFSEKVYSNWLWRACWKENYMVLYSMMGGGGGEGMLVLSEAEGMSQALSMETFYSAQSLQAESIQFIYEPTPAQLAENIALILDFLDTVLEEENPENEEGILEIKAVLEDWLEQIEL